MTRRYESKPLRDTANGSPCLLQVAGVPGHSTETVVFCHAPGEFHGMGMKSPDWWGCAGCYWCHRVLDGVDPDPLTGKLMTMDERRFYWFRGVMRQWDRWVRDGIWVEARDFAGSAGGTA